MLAPPLRMLMCLLHPQAMMLRLQTNGDVWYNGQPGSDCCDVHTLTDPSFIAHPMLLWLQISGEVRYNGQPGFSFDLQRTACYVDQVGWWLRKVGESVCLSLLSFIVLGWRACTTGQQGLQSDALLSVPSCERVCKRGLPGYKTAPRAAALSMCTCCCWLGVVWGF